MTPDQQVRLDRINEDDNILRMRFEITLDEISDATKNLDEIFYARANLNAQRIAILKEQINATQT